MEPIANNLVIMTIKANMQYAFDFLFGDGKDNPDYANTVYNLLYRNIGMTLDAGKSVFSDGENIEPEDILEALSLVTTSDPAFKDYGPEALQAVNYVKEVMTKLVTEVINQRPTTQDRIVAYVEGLVRLSSNSVYSVELSKSLNQVVSLVYNTPTLNELTTTNNKDLIEHTVSVVSEQMNSVINKYMDDNRNTWLLPKISNLSVLSDTSVTDTVKQQPAGGMTAALHCLAIVDEYRQHLCDALKQNTAACIEHIKPAVVDYILEVHFDNNPHKLLAEISAKGVDINTTDNEIIKLVLSKIPKQEDVAERGLGASIVWDDESGYNQAINIGEEVILPTEEADKLMDYTPTDNLSGPVIYVD